MALRLHLFNYHAQPLSRRTPCDAPSALSSSPSSSFLPRRPSSATRCPAQYVNTSNGGHCAIYRDGRGYLFVNENGDRARYEFVAPDRLAIVFSRKWDPRTVAIVQVDGYGRTAIRFKSPGSRAGYWERVR